MEITSKHYVNKHKLHTCFSLSRICLQMFLCCQVAITFTSNWRATHLRAPAPTGSSFRTSQPYRRELPLTHMWESITSLYFLRFIELVIRYNIEMNYQSQNIRYKIRTFWSKYRDFVHWNIAIEGILVSQKAPFLHLTLACRITNWLNIM